MVDRGRRVVWFRDCCTVRLDGRGVGAILKQVNAIAISADVS